MSDDTVPLTRVEQVAMALLRFTNERELPKRMQSRFLRAVTYGWVWPTVARRVYIHGADWLTEFDPDRGVALVSNHRSFFDMYVIALSVWSLQTDWADRIYFPVRANFFYERPLGVVMNFLIGGGCMYPPVFRDPAKAALNKDAVVRVIHFLSRRGTIVGMHPEGTRGKGPDPYELLPAQPGVGQMVLQAKPIVVPIFINGLSNEFRIGVRDTYRSGARRDNPVIIKVGPEVDYSEFTKKKPRVALYKRCADRMNAIIKQLGEEERELRAACARGDISDDDPSWLFNLRRACIERARAQGRIK